MELSFTPKTVKKYSFDSKPAVFYSDFHLQNYPNPFYENTTISWQLPKDAHVVLKVYNFTGREVKILVNCDQSQGEHRITFDTTGLPAGVYFYQLLVDVSVKTGKMVVCR